MAQADSPAQLAVLVLGCIACVASAGATLAGLLELLVILGPVSLLGSLRITSWWTHNAVMMVVWLPLLAIAGWQLHDYNWQDAIPFLAIGAFFVVLHMLLLFGFWLRWLLRKQAAKELPTQELLTEAQRVMMGASGELASPTPAGAPGVDGRFQLQVGRTDGVRGYTLYIPGEEEEAVLQQVTQRHFQKQRLASSGHMAAAGAAQPPLSPSRSPYGQPQGNLSLGSRTLRSSAASFRDMGEPTGLPTVPSSPRTSATRGLGYTRSVRTASQSPERASDGASTGGASSGHVGLAPLSVADRVSPWRRGRGGSDRYFVLTDSALPSPAAGLPAPPEGAQHRPTQSKGSERDFSFGHRDDMVAHADQMRSETPHAGQVSIVVGGGTPGGSGGGGEGTNGPATGAGVTGNTRSGSQASSDSMLEVSNPMFGSEAISLGNEISLRAGQGDALVDAALAGAASAASATSTSERPGSAGLASAPVRTLSGAAAGGTTTSAGTTLAPRLWPGGQSIVSRHSMDPSTLATGGVGGRGGVGLQGSRLAAPPNKHLITAPAAMDGSGLQGPPQVLQESTSSRRVDFDATDSVKTGLLDSIQQVANSSSTVDLPSPVRRGSHSSQPSQTGAGVGGSGGGDAGTPPGHRTGSGSSGLVGRLWNTHHTRTRSFPLASSLTSALLHDHDDSSATVAQTTSTPREQRSNVSVLDS